MNVDIRIDVGFPNHRKTKKLIQKLGLSGPTHLIFLWSSIAESRPKGILTGMDESDIALDAQWPGDANEFVSSLLTVGFLEKSEDGVYMVHDWKEHQPFIYYADERSAQAAEAARIRWESKPHAKRKRTACAPHAERNAPSPIPSPYPYPIPSPIKADVWSEFVKMRKKIKKPLTDHAAELILKDALKIAKEYSQDPNDIIDQSTKRDWAGVFDIKGDTGPPKDRPKEKWELALEGKL